MEVDKNSAVSALLEEYKKAINELIQVISEVSHSDLTMVRDHDTNDKDCKSIQSILSHVVQSGYTYVIEIRKWLGEDVEYRDKVLLDDIKTYETALLQMFDFNKKLFSDYPNLILEDHDPRHKIRVRWGQLYDIEQLFEHAIVHVLRHRRQLEKFLNQKANR